METSEQQLKRKSKFFFVNWQWGMGSSYSLLKTLAGTTSPRQVSTFYF